MKVFLSLILILFVQTSHAVQWKVFGACSDVPVHEGSDAMDISRSVGDVTLDILKKHDIPHVGHASGIKSILNTPMDLDAIEVLSDEEMRVYGWCFVLNGKQPDKMPDEIHLNSQDDKLYWFYAYSTNRKNEWVDYCMPAYWIKPDFICKK